MEAGPAYYMAVPGRNDPMLSYITTGFRDHAWLRKKHGRKVSQEMAPFFREVGIMKENGDLTGKVQRALRFLDSFLPHCRSKTRFLFDIQFCRPEIVPTCT